MSKPETGLVTLVAEANDGRRFPFEFKHFPKPDHPDDLRILREHLNKQMNDLPKQERPAGWIIVKEGWLRD